MLKIIWVVTNMFVVIHFRCSSPLCVFVTIRIQPVGLVERIQAIAQNMSDMALRVEQILQRSVASSRGAFSKTRGRNAAASPGEYQIGLEPLG